MAEMMQCPLCGQETEMSEQKAEFFCMHCGGRITRPQPEMPEETDPVERASVLVHNGEFAAAEEVIESLLQENPDSADCYMLRLLCRLQLRNIAQLSGAEVLLSAQPDFQKALACADAVRQAQYRQLEEQNRQRLLQQQIQMEQQLSRLPPQLRSLEAFLNKHGDLYGKQIKDTWWKKMLRIVEWAFVVANVFFWTVGVFAVPMMLVIDAPFIIWLIFVIRRSCRRKTLIQFQQKQARYEALQAQLRQGMAQYRSWSAQRQMPATFDPERTEA